MMYGDGWGWGWTMMLMPLSWIAITAVIVWAVLKVVQRPASHGIRTTTAGDATGDPGPAIRVR